MNSWPQIISGVRLITFDCYGTLIDWESGIRKSLEDVLGSAGVHWSEKYFDRYLTTEAQLEAEPYQPYRDILTAVEDRLLTEAGVSSPPEPRLADSQAHWLPFHDTVDSLARLKKHFQLGILSNVDRTLFAHTAEHLKVPMDWVITAQDVRSYKPAHGHFLQMLQKTGLKKEQVLHTAQSLFHDIRPCNQLGIPCVWINRRNERNTTTARPWAEFPDLASFADAVLSFGNHKA